MALTHNVGGQYLNSKYVMLHVNNVYGRAIFLSIFHLILKAPIKLSIHKFIYWNLLQQH